MSESTRALEGPRRLTKDIPAYEGIYGAGLVYPPAGGWENGAQANLIYYETYFDLSANTLDDLTFVPTGVVLQDPGRYISTNDDLNIEVVDIISQERLYPDDFNPDLELGNLPGGPLTKNDYTQIIAGNYRLMVRNNTTVAAGILSTIDGGSFGSGEATAATKLWTYRFIRYNGPKVPGDTVKVPASRFVMTGTVIKEEDLPYMMRLKRSYELSTNQ